MWDQNYAYSELPDEEEAAEELEFMLRTLDLKDDAVILDLCCGEGRHSRALAALGYSVVGVDASPSLISIAQKESVGSKDARLWFLQGDMRNIPLHENSCDAVINLFTSFGFFDDFENLQTLRSASSVLKPNGKLLLDYWNPYAAAQLDGVRNWWWITDSLLALAEVNYDFTSGRLQDTRTLVDVETGTVEKAVRDIRFYMLQELEEMLAKAGLHVQEVYGDIDAREYDGESRRLITISVRDA